MRWTQEQLDAYEARRANRNRGAVPFTELERPVCNEPVEETPRKVESPNRVLIHFESRRARLIDPDNLCPKFAMDCLRYCGIIQDDAAKFVEIKVTQTKVKKDAECTVITITPLEG